jgi:hypothetical protein
MEVRSEGQTQRRKMFNPPRKETFHFFNIFFFNERENIQFLLRVLKSFPVDFYRVELLSSYTEKIKWRSVDNIKFLFILTTLIKDS